MTISRLSVRCLLALACISAALALSMSYPRAQTVSGGAREVPAKMIPVPDTVSPQMKKLIAAPLKVDLERDPEDCRRMERAGNCFC